MKKYFKYSIYSFIMLTVTLLLSGCHSMYGLHFEFDGTYMNDKLIDILVQIDERDPNYRESGMGVCYAFNGTDMSEEEIAQTEIARYNENGYKSLLLHHHLEEYDKTTTDDNKVGRDIYFNSKKDFISLCNRYKKFRIAVIDMNGRILQISDEIPFKSSEKYYIDHYISYDPEKNEVSPVYNKEGHQDPLLLLALFIVKFIMYFMPLYSLIVLFFVIFFKDAKISAPPYSIVLSLLFNIPLIINVIVRADEAVKSTLTLSAAIEKFFDLGDGSVLISAYYLIPLVVFWVVSILSLVRKYRNKDFSVKEECKDES